MRRQGSGPSAKREDLSPSTGSKGEKWGEMEELDLVFCTDGEGDHVNSPGSLDRGLDPRGDGQGMRAWWRHANLLS